MTTHWKPYAALAGICFFWGTTYFAIRVGVKHFPPFLFSGLRFVIAGSLILMGHILKKHRQWPSRNELLRIIVGGVFVFIGGNLLLVLAEQSVNSSLAALINTAFPIWILIITKIWNPSERIKLLSVWGIVIGFIGQVLIFSSQQIQSSEVSFSTGLLLAILGVINAAIGTVYIKKQQIKTTPVMAGGIQMLFCGLITVFIGGIKGEFYLLNPDPTGWISMFYLIIFGSIITYSLFLFALDKLPASQVSVYAFVNPVIALVLGTLFLHEEIQTGSIAAMVVTLTGVYLVNRGMKTTN